MWHMAGPGDDPVPRHLRRWMARAFPHFALITIYEVIS
jgi:hypothetical protein